MEPADMHPKHTDTDAVVPERVRRGYNAAANEQLPKSIWQPGVVQRLAEYIKHLREVDQQSDKPNVASKPDQPDQRHVCTRNPHRSCNCPRRACADDSESYRYARGPYLVADEPITYIHTPKPNELGNFSCPVNNKLCSQDVCWGWCRGG